MSHFAELLTLIGLYTLLFIAVCKLVQFLTTDNPKEQEDFK